MSAEPARLLALYWQRSRDKRPVYVARDASGGVLAWSRSRSDAMRLAPDYVTCEREVQP